jgi:ligand-binding SRPBCC domain-containing protein
VSFTSTITQQDRDLLRGIVRKVHLSSLVAKHGHHFVTDHECDKLIDSIAPEVVENMIRFGVDKGLR